MKKLSKQDKKRALSLLKEPVGRVINQINFLALIIGSLSVLAYPPTSCLWILFFTYSILFYKVNEADNRRKAVLFAGFFGGSFFVFQLFWAVKMFYWNYSFPVYFLFLFILFLLGFFFFGVPAYLSFYYRKGLKRFIAFCCFLSLFEWGRTYILFQLPWNLTVSVFTDYPRLLQINSLIGPFGCCLLFNFIFISPLFLLKKYKYYKTFLFAVCLFVCSYIYGFWRLQKAQFEHVPNVSLRLAQHLSLVTSSAISDPKIFTDWMNFIQKKDIKGIKMVIWPENSIATKTENEPFLFNTWTDEIPEGILILTGNIRLIESPVSYNSIVLINDQKRITHIQNKWKLVPLGEYIPLIGDYLPPLTNFGNNKKGDGPKTFHVKGLPPFAPVNCIELIYPRIFIDRKDRPQWIANPTNDSGFIHDAGAYQFLAAAKLRAVEEGLPVARVTTPYGISAMINGYGLIEQSIPIGKDDILDVPLPKALPPTLYSKLGNLPFLIISLALLSICLLLEASEKRIKE